MSFLYVIMEEKSDPRVKEWSLINTPLPTLAIVSTYLGAVLVVLPSFMKNKKPLDITGIIRFYNILQIISCTAIIFMTVSSGYWQGKYSWACQPTDYSNDYYAVKLLSVFYYNYLIKMFELVETVFFILRKKFKQVSALHVYHHSSTLVLSWIGCKFTGGGTFSLPIMLNAFIHILMYTYYYLSSLGPAWQKKLAPWKPKLTILQMVQFTILILHAIIALQPRCKVPKQVLLLYVPNVILIYKMFYDFYQKNYRSKYNVNGVNKSVEKIK